MIKQKPTKIPTAPGIYFFKNKQGRVLYVGKAANLKNRLTSYFNKPASPALPRDRPNRGEQAKDPRITQMLTEADKVDWQELDSEIEALIKEAELIKDHRPRYNIIFRDDKQYSYVIITDEVFARIFVAHQPDNFPDALVIGPFVDAGALRTTLKLFRRIFPYCTCKKPHVNYCLNYHIGQCLGFCCLKNPTVTQEQLEEYKEDIKAVRDLLRGRKQSVIAELEKQMKASGSEENFEKAIVLQNKLEKLKATFENAKIIRELTKKRDVLSEIEKILKLPTSPQRIEGYDVSNIQGQFAVGAMVVFTEGNPDRAEYRKFQIRWRESLGDTGMIKEILKRRFRHPEWQYPDLILIDGGKGQLNATSAIIHSHALSIPIVALTKNDKHKGDHILATTIKGSIDLPRLPEAAKHLILHIDAEAHRFAIGYYRKLHRTKLTD